MMKMIMKWKKKTTCLQPRATAMKVGLQSDVSELY